MKKRGAARPRAAQPVTTTALDPTKSHRSTSSTTAYSTSLTSSTTWTCVHAAATAVKRLTTPEAAA